ncbi:MAG TPA: polysaccharide deacetylase family protein, partial [Polyangia bacterium]|nr:polysaccharide deacetylase family protein [Polyangia bacterium]
MLVVRRLYPLAAFVVPLLAPALVGGSDQPRPTRARSLAPVAAPFGTYAGDVLPPEVVAPFESPGHGPHVAFHAATEPRKLLLSFDDGPDLRGTPLILDELDRRGLKAIFFVTGWRLKGDRPEDVARRDLVRKIAAHGHLVANHTVDHHDLCQNPAEQAEQIDANAELITETTGVRPFLFRSPYGAFCKSLEAALDARGLVDVGWNIDPQDWKVERDEEAVFNYLTDKLATLQGRGILLMHDTHLASVHALPRVLDWLARQSARDVRAGRAPIKIVDYREIVPARPLAAGGLPELVGAL